MSRTKLESFDSPFSRAQLGVALALYGDRIRAERAFDSALWLAEKREADATYGSTASYSYASLQRDVAGMLALATEVRPALGSLEAIKDLARRIYNPEKRLNTQELAWMVMSARTQSGPDDDLGIAVNGSSVSGALQEAYNGPKIDAEPVTIANTGDQPLEALVTISASPQEPLPAGGDGFGITRSYHALDGSPISIAEVQQNDRFVVVINASQFDDVPSRLMITDLLPAGLEVENPHLIQSAQEQNFSWLPKTDGCPCGVPQRPGARSNQSRPEAGRKTSPSPIQCGPFHREASCIRLPLSKTCIGLKSRPARQVAG